MRQLTLLNFCSCLGIRKKIVKKNLSGGGFLNAPCLGWEFDANKLHAIGTLVAYIFPNLLACKFISIAFNLCGLAQTLPRNTKGHPGGKRGYPNYTLYTHYIYILYICAFMSHETQDTIYGHLLAI